MSICKDVTSCLATEANRAVSYIQNDCRLLYGIGLVAASILFAYVHAFGVPHNYNEDFRAAIITTEITLMLIAFLPMSITHVLSQLTLLAEGPLCLPQLGKYKIRKTLEWAVSELTPVSSLPGRLKFDYEYIVMTIGVLRIAIGAIGLYQAGYMQQFGIRRGHVINTSILSGILVLFGMSHLFLDSDFIKLDEAFNGCLKFNESV